VHSSSWTPSQERFLRDLASEAGFALETAHLYEQAVSAKERTEAILSRVADGVVVTDRTGVVLGWNAAAETITGCPANAAAGRRCEDVIGLRAGERELDCRQGCALLRAAAQRNGGGGLEVWRQHPDGRRQPLLADVSAVVDADGNVSEVVHSLRDITRLKEADEAKTLFLATASHELKTPLTVIQGFSETLLTAGKALPEDTQRRALEAVERRASQLNRIVNRLLLASRIDAGRLHVEPTEIDLEPILIERVDALAALDPHQLSLSIDGPLPSVLADAEAVETVIDHLLDNALKYSPESAPVRVHADANDAEVRVAVRDNGIGMDAQQVLRCFEKFWQGESTDVRRYGGTGIGLYIVRTMIDAMGGDVAVTSSPGTGSTFTFTVPRAGVVREDDQPPPDETDPGVGEPSMIREFMRQIGVPSRRQL
jgi:PAS domain S-box-containing protein